MSIKMHNKIDAILYAKDLLLEHKLKQLIALKEKIKPGEDLDYIVERIAHIETVLQNETDLEKMQRKLNAAQVAWERSLRRTTIIKTVAFGSLFAGLIVGGLLKK